MTDPDLLAHSSQPGQPLLNAFAGVAARGVTATFEFATDTDPTTQTLGSVDTRSKPAAAQRACFEGYLEVGDTGQYRFLADVTDASVNVELHFAHLPESLIVASRREGVTELKAGIPYRFTVDVTGLGSGDASLLVRGETLPRGSLDRLTLYPQAAVDRCREAQVLLAKGLQIVQGLNLSEREVRYLLMHPEDFGGLSFSSLPTNQATTAATDSGALMAQFLRLVAYARLKRDLAPGTDDLITLFENARRSAPGAGDLCQRLANLTRRPLATVQAVAEHLGFIEADGSTFTVVDGGYHFAQEQGVDRLWQALQVVEKLGLPVATVVQSTEIVSSAATADQPFAIAQNLRNTVKARYEPETWQRIAQPIFDRLRQRQRDALVAHIMHVDRFARMEQLFESFLIDPGMEPVVQTSRVRLAISSVQLFIQRCLLNLEPMVHPSAINSQHWQWMKRYRVWEANRKFFLYPENWLEPEFRDDKTHPFRELESTLLQGDVSNDVAEDAFFAYLSKLEKLARLEIVSMYCEEKDLSGGESILHVIGRTYNTPHEYFYRRYDTASGMWTPWEPVTAQIEGDHVVAAVWRQRLHLFWFTFMEKAESSVDEDDEETDFQAMAEEPISANMPKKMVGVQLNWCEYYQGRWTTRESSGFSQQDNSIPVESLFDKSDVFVHVIKEYEGVEERAITIHLVGAMSYAFRVVGKNSPPVQARALDQESPRIYYNHRKATHYTQSGRLSVSAGEIVELQDGEPVRSIAPPEEKPILSASIERQSIDEDIDDFSLLVSSNLSDLVRASGTPDSPLFYQDAQHTFFVEPKLLETSIPNIEEYGAAINISGPEMDEPKWWQEPYVEAEPMPMPSPSVEDERIGPIGPYAHHKVKLPSDWATDSAVVIQFNGVLIGQQGGLDVTTAEATSGGGATRRRMIFVGSSGMNSTVLAALEALRSDRAAMGLRSGVFPS